MTPTERITLYKEAYRAANPGNEIDVIYSNGWYLLEDVNRQFHSKWSADKMMAAINILRERVRPPQKEVKPRQGHLV